jgi:branched-chain amino acid transport system permease protein
VSALGGTAGPIGPAWLRRLRIPGPTLVRHLALAAAIGLVLYLVAGGIGAYRDLQLATAGYYFAALAGLTVLTGLSGQISIGHGALMAVGAYAAALLLNRLHWSLFPVLVVASAITAVIGALFGSAAARLRGPYLAGATLAFAVGLPALADRYPGAFGGENGLIVNPPTPPASLGLTFPLERWQAWISCGAGLVVLVLLANLVRGRTGRQFRAVRDDEIAAQLAGIPVARTQITAFVVSAACAGLGGALLVVVTSLAAPGAFTLALSLSLLTGVVLGGLGSLAGAAWGAAALVFLPQWTTNLAHKVSVSDKVTANLPFALYGLVLIGVMLAAPGGIQGALRGVVGLGRRRFAQAGRTKTIEVHEGSLSKQEEER